LLFVELQLNAGLRLEESAVLINELKIGDIFGGWEILVVKMWV